MARGKSINMYLMDGDVNGRIKCTLANWTGLAFKIPRTSLDLCKDREELMLSADDENISIYEPEDESFYKRFYHDLFHSGKKIEIKVG